MMVFNFESFQGFHPRLPRGFIAAAVVVLCLEVTLRAIPIQKLVPYFSRFGFAAFMEREVIPQFPHPQIVLFGTSRIADALMPTLVDDELGLPPFSTLNLGIFGSRTSDWLDLYKRNRKELSQAKLLVLNLDEWSFNSGIGSDEHFCLTAPLVDRIHFLQPVEIPYPEGSTPRQRAEQLADKSENLLRRRNRLLADWLFETRLKLTYVPHAILRLFHSGYNRAPIFDANHMVRSTQADVGRENDDPSNYDYRIQVFYKMFDTHPIYVRHVEELAALCKEDGVRFVLMDLPNKREFQNEVDKLYPEAYRQHVRVNQELAARLNVPLYYREYPEEIGLTDLDFEDHCHMAYTGAVKTTAWFVRTVTQDSLLSGEKSRTRQ